MAAACGKVVGASTPMQGTFRVQGFGRTVGPKQLEIGLRPNSAGIPYTLLLRIEAIGFPTFRLLLWGFRGLQFGVCLDP